MIQHINKLFMGVIVLSLLTFFERADYNLPLYVFALFLWNHKNQHQRLWYLMAFSLLVDVIWIIYWAATWNSFVNRQIGLCNFTVIVSAINFVLKLVIVILLFIKDEQCKQAITQLPSNIKSICSGPSVNQFHSG